MSFITSILLWDLFLPFTGFPVRSETWKIFPKTETIRSHNSRAGKPSNFSPVSKEMISDSVELWETDVCFLHIQLIRTNVWLPKTHNVPPEVDFESSRSPAKSDSWNSPNLHCSAQVWWFQKINRFKRLSQATSLHPFCRNTKILRVWYFLYFSRWNSRFEHGSVIVHNIFACFTLSLSATQVYIQERCWLLQNRLLCWVVSTSDQDFVSFQPILCHPHTQIRIILFYDENGDIPIWNFSQPCFNRIFSNWLSHNSPAKSGYDIHDFSCCHLRCCRSLFSEYCIKAKVVFYNITAEHNSTFIFLVLLPPIQHFSDDRCPLMMQNEL